MKRFVSLMVVLLLALVTTVAQAQTPQGPGRGGPGMMGRSGGGSPLMLLRLEQVQKELELVDEQKQKLQTLGEETMKKMREQFAGMRDLAEDERRAQYEKLREKMQEQTKELEKKVEGILLPHQIDRLKQIQLQIQGSRALADEKVVEALGITEEQKTKFNEIRDAMRQKMQGVGAKFRELRDLEEDQRRAKSEELRARMREAAEAAKEKALSVLSDEQRQTLEKMKGEKFEIDWSQLQRRGRGERRE